MHGQSSGNCCDTNKSSNLPFEIKITGTKAINVSGHQPTSTDWSIKRPGSRVCMFTMNLTGNEPSSLTRLHTKVTWSLTCFVAKYEISTEIYRYTIELNFHNLLIYSTISDCLSLKCTNLNFILMFDQLMRYWFRHFSVHFALISHELETYITDIKRTVNLKGNHNWLQKFDGLNFLRFIDVYYRIKIIYWAKYLELFDQIFFW